MTLLTNAREEMRRALGPPSQADQRGAVLDIRMLVMPGGRERTEDEYRELIGVRGISTVKTVTLPEPMDIAIIERVCTWYVP